MPELKLYTVKDLREWLIYDHPAEGLSERVIAPTRAWAIIHNPYVKDEDAIVAAIFEDGELAAYTASFPDMLDGKRVWWASTLYCYPKFTGKGYGLIVVGSLMEAHEPDLTYDRWGANETIEIFNYLGYKTIYTSRYHLADKTINLSTYRGKSAFYVQELKKRLHPWPKPSKVNYTLQYSSFVDGETYAFMMAHKGNDLWLREQGMLNWILGYPFKISCILYDRVDKKCEFGSEMVSYRYMLVKMYVDNDLHAVYVIRQNNESLSVIYLYYDEEYQNVAFASIVDHIIKIKPRSFTSEHKELCTYVRNRLYFPKYVEERVSLSLPEIEGEYTMQMGDGDSYA